MTNAAQRMNGRASIGGYALEGRLGRGPHAEVWSARSSADGAAVAVKVFDDHVASAGSLAKFETVTAAAAAMAHRNVARLLSRGIDVGRWYTVTPLYRSSSLRSSGLGTTFLTGKLVAFAGALCGALDYAHQRSVVHGHLSADNVFFDADGTPVVADFGHAQLALGTRGSARRLDVETDLWDLAELLAKLASGQSFDGRLVPTGRYSDSPKLDAVLRRALSPNEADRYRRASELALALALVGDGDSHAADGPPPSRTNRGGVSVANKQAVVTVSMSAGTTAPELRTALRDAEALLPPGGRARVAYDLAEVLVLDPDVEEAIATFHKRHLRRIEHVGFASPRANVRARLLRLTGNLGEASARVFGSVEPMVAWLQRGNS